MPGYKFWRGASTLIASLSYVNKYDCSATTLAHDCIRSYLLQSEAEACDAALRKWRWSKTNNNPTTSKLFIATPSKQFGLLMVALTLSTELFLVCQPIVRFANWNQGNQTDCPLSLHFYVFNALIKNLWERKSKHFDESSLTIIAL